MKLPSVAYGFIFYLMTSACADGSEKDKQPLEEVIPPVYSEQGGNICRLSQNHLMSRVMTAMSEEGPSGAVAYCSLHALQIADSLSVQFNCRIDRISPKNRNPDNAPADREEAILLNSYLEDHLEGEELTPQLRRKGKDIIYYQPIILGMEGCLKCHGLPQQDIDNTTLAVLHERYPKDKATGYRLGDFRGAWRITFSD